MGNFSYICNKCGKSIRGGERAVLKHYRHGELIGMANGFYDGYGRIEGTSYRDSCKGNPCSHEEIHRSEFGFTDSKDYDGRVFRGKPTTWIEFTAIKTKEKGEIDFSKNAIHDEWQSLEKYVPEKIQSGTAAYHEYCYEQLNDEEKEVMVLSEGDPNQSWGKPRENFVRKIKETQACCNIKEEKERIKKKRTRDIRGVAIKLE